MDSDTDTAICINKYTTGYSKDPITRLLSLEVTINSEPETMDTIAAKLVGAAQTRTGGPWSYRTLAGYGIIMYDGQIAFRITPNDKANIKKYWVTHEKGGKDRDHVIDEYTELLQG